MVLLWLLLQARCRVRSVSPGASLLCVYHVNNSSDTILSGVFQCCSSHYITSDTLISVQASEADGSSRLILSSYGQKDLIEDTHYHPVQHPSDADVKHTVMIEKTECFIWDMPLLVIHAVNTCFITLLYIHRMQVLNTFSDLV